MTTPTQTGTVKDWKHDGVRVVPADRLDANTRRASSPSRRGAKKRRSWSGEASRRVTGRVH